MIGVFDSGIGGLTVLSAIRELLPQVPLIYIADQKYAPYGDLPQQDVITRSELISNWLIEQGCDVVVVACNTATALAIDHLRKRFTIPFVGVEPGIKPAALSSQSRSIGILATSNTVASERYQALIQRFLPDVAIYSQACIGLADAIETGSSELDRILDQYCRPLAMQGVDQIVLGCTHYPLVKQSIEDRFAGSVKVIDTSDAIAMEVCRRYTGSQPGHSLALYSTSQSDAFAAVTPLYERLDWLQSLPVASLLLTQSS